MVMGIQLRDNKGRIRKGNNLKHGLSKSPIYDCWIAMKARCLNPQHPEYNSYGGRGIKVSPLWVNNFELFLKDVGQKPYKYSTLDRIDNDGDYEPNNCRWISIQKQQQNRRDNGIVVGVNFEKSRNKWRATITRFRKKYFLGRYNKFEEAVSARLKAENGI